MLVHPQFIPAVAALADPDRGPAWVERFQSDSVDAVQAHFSRAYGDHSRVARGQGPFVYSSYWIMGQRVGGAAAQTSQPATVRGRLRHPVMHFALPVGTTYRIGRRVVQAGGPGRAVIVPAECEFSRTSPAGGLFSALIDADLLRNELSARHPDDAAGWVVRLGAVDLTESDARQWVEALTAFLLATPPDGDPRSLAHAEAHVGSLMATALWRGRLVERAGAIDPVRVKNLEDWIDAHLDVPITLGRLCAVAGVGERSLQKAFENARGMSPMRFVLERRLIAAHHRLRAPGKRPSVKAVALDLGFQHLGRFAQAYRELIGESPSQTAAPAGRRTGPLARPANADARPPPATA